MSEFTNGSHCWQHATLGEAIERIETGVSPRTLDRPVLHGEMGVLKVSAVTWGTFRPEENKALPTDFDVTGIPTVRKGDLLLSRANTAELLASPVIAKKDYPNLILSDKTLRLVPVRGVSDPRFLFYGLRQPEARRFFFANATGTSGSMRNVSQATIRRCPIPLPPLSEQKRIADILDKADAIVRKRQVLLSDARRLTSSIFQRMFFATHTCPKGRLGDYTTKITSGSTPLGGRNVYLDEGPVMLVRSQNILMNRLDLSDVAYISEELNQQMERSVVHQHDVLLNITGASIGRVARFPFSDRRANVNQHVCIIRCDSKRLNPVFVEQFLSTTIVQSDINNRHQRGGTRQALTFSQIADFQIPIPSPDLQKKYEGAVDQTTKLIERLSDAIGEALSLFNSLVQRAFKREL